MTTPTPSAGSSAEDLVLAGDFDIPTHDQWAAEVAKVLNKGRPENKLLSADQALDRLRTHTVDSLTIEPIYTVADAIGELGAPGTVPFTRGTTVRNGEMDAWEVCALHEDPDAARTREAIAPALLSTKTCGRGGAGNPTSRTARTRRGLHIDSKRTGSPNRYQRDAAIYLVKRPQNPGTTGHRQNPGGDRGQ